jgi:hypothetical protein
MSNIIDHRTCKVCRQYGEYIPVDLYISEGGIKSRLINAFDGATHYHVGIPKQIIKKMKSNGWGL